jgi:hypothetical protein
MPRRVVLLVGGAAAAIIALALIALFVIFPGGAPSSDAAVLDRVGQISGAAAPSVLVKTDWGDGQLVLIAYNRGAARRLGLAFVAHGARGWRLGSYTEETTDRTDIVVGSLLLASSEGGAGQPAWSAAVGELTDPRIARVEVTWSNGGVSVGSRVNNAYIVTEPGTAAARTARFLAKDGTEIAKVPINTGA